MMAIPNTRPRRGHRLALCALGVMLLALPLSAAAQRVLIIQTNAAGDNVHLIDPTTNTIAGEITGVEVIHGVAAAPDGSRLYLSNESTDTLDIVDTKTLKVTKQIPLSGRPNNVAIHKDGRRVYVAIQGTGGGVDVIDTVADEHVKFIRILRGVHNTFITPDSKYVVAGSTGGRTATIIDTELERPVWALHFEGGVRPLTFDTNPDGSTRNMYVQITNLHGFAVVDFEKRVEVRRITLPDVSPAERNREGIQGAPAHGIKMSPDGTTLWSTSKVNSHVYAYSLPDLEYVGGVRVGTVPDWLTFTPDSRFLYVANATRTPCRSSTSRLEERSIRSRLGRYPNGTSQRCFQNCPRLNKRLLWLPSRRFSPLRPRRVNLGNSERTRRYGTGCSVTRTRYAPHSAARTFPCASRSAGRVIGRADAGPGFPVLQGPRGAHPSQSPQGQCPVRRLSFARRRQQLPRAAGSEQYDV